MSSLKRRIEKLSKGKQQLPRIVIYQAGEPIPASSSRVTVYLPDNNREKSKLRAGATDRVL